MPLLSEFSERHPGYGSTSVLAIAHVGNFHLADEITAGKLVVLLDDFNPQDRDPIHAVFVGGSHMPARVRVFVDFLVERLATRQLG